MKKFHVNTSKIDTVFIVCLFMIFVITAGLLVLIMARQYQATVDSMNENYEVRTVSSYLTEKVRSHDTSGAVSVTEFDGICALALSESADNGYTTYIYFCDGSIRELLAADGAALSPESGQAIAEVDSFEISLVRDGLLYVSFADTNGVSHEQYISYMSPAGKEAS